MLRRERGDCGFGGGARCGGTVLGVHELGDDTIEGFFAVDEIAVGGVGGVEDGGEELVKAGEAGDGGAIATGAWVVRGVGVGRLSKVLEEGAHDFLEVVVACVG